MAVSEVLSTFTVAIFSVGNISAMGYLYIDTTAETNKRPRGLDALLGHLLDKIIAVRNKLSSTKIPDNLS